MTPTYRLVLNALTHEAYAYFADPTGGDTILNMDWQVWQDLGRPGTISITPEPAL